MSQKKVLFVYTSADKLLDGSPTGWYLPEAAHPFYTLRDHVTIDFASPRGPHPPLDPKSVEQFKTDEECAKFLTDTEVTQKTSIAKPLSVIDAADYDAIFYIGGHGPVIDLAIDTVNIELLNDFWRGGKIVSAVCHGTAALVGGTDASGNSILKGRRVMGFSNAEEEQVGKTVPTHLPFSVEDRVKELGGNYEKVEPWAPGVVVDGKLITGQNPASAKGVAEEILRALQ